MTSDDRRETLIVAAKICKQLSDHLTQDEIGSALAVAVSDEGVVAAIAGWAQGWTETLGALFQELGGVDDAAWDAVKRQLEKNGQQSG